MNLSFDRTDCLECGADPAKDPVGIMPGVQVCRPCLQTLVNNVKGNIGGRLKEFFEQYPWAKPVVQAFARGVSEKMKQKKS